MFKYSLGCFPGMVVLGKKGSVTLLRGNWLTATSYSVVWVNKITNLFKNHAANRLWLNFHQFVTVHM